MKCKHYKHWRILETKKEYEIFTGNGGITAGVPDLVDYAYFLCEKDGNVIMIKVESF